MLHKPTLKILNGKLFDPKGCLDDMDNSEEESAF